MMKKSNIDLNDRLALVQDNTKNICNRKHSTIEWNGIFREVVNDRNVLFFPLNNSITNKIPFCA